MRILGNSTLATSILLMLAALLPGGAMAAEPAVGLISNSGSSPQLVTFDTAGRVLNIVDVDDVGMGYDAKAIALRPSTGDIYLLSTFDTGAGLADTAGRVYTVDLDTGTATLVGAGDFATSLNDNAGYGISFSPVADRLRLVNTSDANLRLNPDTGVIVNADTALAPAGFISALAYDRYFDPPAATTLYALDWASDELVRIGGVDGSPSVNGGIVTVIGAAGVSLSSTAGIGFAPSGTAFVTNPGQAGASHTGIYSLDLQTGAATLVAGLKPSIEDVVFLPGSTVDSAVTATAAESAGVAVIPITRTGDTTVPTEVSFTTSDSTAVAGDDYVTTSGTVKLAAGDTQGEIVIPLVGDSTAEDAETFNVTITDSSDSLLGAASTIVTVTDVADGADTRAPHVLMLPLGTIASRSLMKKGLKVSFSCSEACTGTGKLAIGSKRLSVTGTTSLTSAGNGKLTLRLTKSARKTLAKRLATSRRVSVKVTLRFVDPSGNARTIRRKLLVTR